MLPLAVKIVPRARGLFSALVPQVTSNDKTEGNFWNQSFFYVQAQHNNKFDVPGILRASKNVFANCSFVESFFLTDTGTQMCNIGGILT